MLGVCSEFERIAKVVIEKSEKDQSSRRKRKNQDGTTDSSTAADGTRPNTAVSSTQKLQTP